MQQETIKYNKLFLIIIALLAWFAVIMQLYLIIINRKSSLPVTLLQFLSFFTILTNLLVAISSSYILLKPNTISGRFFSRPSALTAITLYIVVVGLVYNLILRHIWAPQGMQKLVDELLHTVIPALFLIFWILCVPKQNLQWTNVFSWLLYPFIYSLFILIRGAVTGLYPYPFLDVPQLGYSTVLINCGYLVLVFLAGALMFIGAGRLAGSFYNRKPPFG